MNRLKMVDINKSFLIKQVLKNINCELTDGVYGLLGENGAGKTTLFRCIVNYYSFSGKILLNDKPLDKKMMKKIGYLPQNFTSFPELTVKETLEYFCCLKEISKAEVNAQIDECLRYTNLADVSKKKIKTLSGGMLRRVGIAQAILGHPELIILDEPTSGLDPEERVRLNNVIQKISDGRIILFSTHIVEDVEASADKVIIMKDGSVMYQGPTKDVRNEAEGKILEVDKEEIEKIPDAYIFKSYYRGNQKVYRALLTNKANIESDMSISDNIDQKEDKNDIFDSDNLVKNTTVEDGYICLCHEK
ncbi:MAG: ATP-binding cassette domain-containing protein [Lachnospiraceae bacterium]|jgi:ABC-2 type transport system ATP-binding protein|nr:ATP-binding cassette domain-containing protein [Lachnospiraceae bacterium]MEE3460869.1 ATP-binding cassette domain-containing protein [Lachnospiraceae bacterium]